VNLQTDVAHQVPAAETAAPMPAAMVADASTPAAPMAAPMPAAAMVADASTPAAAPMPDAMVADASTPAAAPMPAATADKDCDLVFPMQAVA